MINDLIKKIEQWAEDRNIIKGSKPIDQAMKLFSEFGELADNVGKGRDCRDDIGDCIVVLTIIAKQIGVDIIQVMEFDHQPIESDIKETVAFLGCSLGSLLAGQEDNIEFGYTAVVGLLYNIAIKHSYTLEECVAIAYNDIKDRTGVVYNGVFIKESDPAYQDALDNIEADKRMATQKRVSVNIEDL